MNGLIDIDGIAELRMNGAFSATVIMTLPDSGGVLVCPNSTDPAKRSMVICASLPYTDGLFGAAPYVMYPAGMDVLCIARANGGTDIVYVIGPLNIATDSRVEGYLGKKQYNAEDWAAADSNATAVSRVLEMLKPNGEHAYVRDRSHGVSGDAIAGDFDVLDKMGHAGVHIGQLISQIKGSAMAFADASVLDSKLRLVGDVISRHTLTHEYETNDGFSVDNTAVNLSEAFGLKSGPVLKQSGSGKELKVEPVNDKAIPLYRIQHMEGAPIDGVEDIIVGFPEKDVHDSDNEPPVLSKRRQGLSGALLDVSAHSLASVKSPLITAAMQLGYGGKSQTLDSKGKFDDLREPYEDPQKESDKLKDADKLDPEQLNGKDKNRAVTDAALNKLIDTLLEGDYRDTLLQIMAQKGFAKSDAKASVYNRIKDRKQRGGVVDAAEYALPDFIELEDPVTHRKKQYYASMSFISQEPDGSICICDGYGSEIRMSRGNIYISPALDCFVRPGRDLSVMAGRHQSYNSQGSCTINTSDSMFIRAVNDLKIGGATSGTGLVVLESCNTNIGEDYGLVIQSRANASFTVSGDLYLGRNSHTQTDKGAVGGEKDTAGNIIIDAGRHGNIYGKGRFFDLDIQQFRACLSAAGETGTGTTGSLLELAPNAVSLFTPTIQTSAQVIAAPPIVNKVVTLVRDGKDVNVTVADATRPTQFNLAGSMLLSGSLHAGGTGVFNGQVQVQGSIIGRGGQVSDSNNIQNKKEVFKDVVITGDRGDALDLTTSVDAAATSVYQNYYVTNNVFRFPLTYEVNSDMVPGMVWQAVAQESGNAQGAFWHEYEITVDGVKTMCYPGYDVWTKQFVSYRGQLDVGPRVQEGYITNARHTEVH